jgi:hypothetical protein
MTGDFAKRHHIADGLEIQLRGGKILDRLRGILSHRFPGIQYGFGSDHRNHFNRTKELSACTLTYVR